MENTSSTYEVSFSGEQFWLQVQASNAKEAFEKGWERIKDKPLTWLFNDGPGSICITNLDKDEHNLMYEGGELFDPDADEDEEED